MSEQTATIIQMRRLHAVMWSQIDKRVKPVQANLVSVFLKYEGCPLLDDKRQPILTPSGRHQEVRSASFARRYGIPPTTFNDWVVAVRGITVPANQRFRTESVRNQHHGQCEHCPDWEEE